MARRDGKIGKGRSPQKYRAAEAVSGGGAAVSPLPASNGWPDKAKRSAPRPVAVDSKANMAEKQSLGQILLTFYRSDAYAHIWY